MLHEPSSRSDERSELTQTHYRIQTSDLAADALGVAEHRVALLAVEGHRMFAFSLGELSVLAGAPNYVAPVKLHSGNRSFAKGSTASLLVPPD